MLIAIVNVMDENLTAARGGRALGVSRPTLYAYVSRGLVVSEPGPGRERRYPRWALDELKAAAAPTRPRSRCSSGRRCSSRRSRTIDGGRLWYRGIDARELSRTATLEQVAGLLWTGALDGADGLFPRSSRRGRRRGSFGDRLRRRARRRARAAAADARRAEPGDAARRRVTVSALFDAAGATGRGTLAERLA